MTITQLANDMLKQRTYSKEFCHFFGLRGSTGAGVWAFVSTVNFVMGQDLKWPIQYNTSGRNLYWPFVDLFRTSAAAWQLQEPLIKFNL